MKNLVVIGIACTATAIIGGIAGYSIGKENGNRIGWKKGYVDGARMERFKNSLDSLEKVIDKAIKDGQTKPKLNVEYDDSDEE